MIPSFLRQDLSTFSWRRLSRAWLLIGCLWPGLAVGQPFTVDSVGDEPDAAIDGNCATVGNECTLRAAIQEANENADLTTINFSIPGCTDGICVIEIASDNSLPDLVAPVIIDGASQGNADICSSAIPDRPDYLVVLDGDADAPALGSGNPGLRLEEGSDGSTIRGLNIRNFTDAVAVINSSNSVVECNFIGTDQTGATSGPGFQNALNGVIIGCTSDDNTIGGTAVGQANLLSGNQVDGVQINGAIPCDQGSGPPTGNSILGNYIGVASDGVTPLGNQFSGVSIFAGTGPDNNFVGLTAGPAYSGNIIGANGTGVYIGPGASGNVVAANFIGTGLDGGTDIGNIFGGVETEGVGNEVGGTDPAAANAIAFNGEGVIVWGDPAVNNRITRNMIYSNGGIGIDLAKVPYTVDGPDPNDPGDVDTGPNELQNHPIIALARLDGGNLQIDYEVDSPTPLAVEFFLADDDDEEGALFLGDQFYSAPGLASLVIPAAGVSEGDFIVATATSAAGDTSEFSPAVPVTVEPTGLPFPLPPLPRPEFPAAPATIPTLPMPALLLLIGMLFWVGIRRFGD